MSIVTGYSVCSEETESTAKEYLQRLFHALICLPESVSRHVSFGAAMWESEGVRINQIQRMPTGRIISKDRASGKWRFPNRNLGDYAQNYVQVIGMLTQECRTPRDVLRVIQSLPQKVVQSVESRFGI